MARFGQFGLFATRRFSALFAVQFLGALNDNVYKNALVILIAYRLAEAMGVDGALMVTAAGGIFILPFFLFSALAGQICDRMAKSRLARWIKAAEVVVMALGAGAFWVRDGWALMGVLFLMGTQSAFFGPAKYAMLPELMKDDELIGANALFGAGTFLAILLGTIAGGLMILGDGGGVMVSALVVGLALLGWWASFAVPETEAAAPGLRINPNIAGETWSIVRHAGDRPGVLPAILGISWFWLVGATFLAQFPNYAKDALGADETVVTLFLTLFSVGIGVGALFCNRLLKGRVSARFVPLGALGMAALSVDLFFATGTPGGGELLDAAAFLAEPANWRIVADLALIAAFGGLYIVPLYAIMQTRCDPARRSRVIAANNILNALFMVVGALAAAAMLGAGASVPLVLLAAGLGNIAAAALLRKL